MLKIALTQFAAPLHGRAELEQSHRELLDGLRARFELVPVRPGEAVDADLHVVFIASGGVEGQFRDAADRLPRPLFLLADGRHNSLAAALEIMSWLRRRGDAPELLHGPVPDVSARLELLVRFERTRRALGGRLGIIGAPSDWLIGSRVDYAAVTRHWGTNLREIDIGELVEATAAVSDDAAAAAARLFSTAPRADGVGETEIAAAIRFYPALKALYARHGLRAATVRCFSLLESLGTTACLALSRLNDEGLIAGCEGDVATLFTMLLARELTGEAPFMANPARIDAAANEVVLAHCTVPAGATCGFRLRTHFESGIGVAIQGDLAPGAATLLKVGGPALDEFFVSAAERLPIAHDEGMCRTQARIRLLDAAVDYFFRAPLANHHVLIAGDHADLVRKFMEYALARLPNAG